MQSIVSLTTSRSKRGVSPLLNEFISYVHCAIERAISPAHTCEPSAGTRFRHADMTDGSSFAFNKPKIFQPHITRLSKALDASPPSRSRAGELASGDR